jgi:hypothetical protein
MPDNLGLVVGGIVMGVAGSTLVDVWSAALRRFGIPTLDFRLLGRWIGHFRLGRFVHERISASDPIRAETAIGWLRVPSCGGEPPKSGGGHRTTSWADRVSPARSRYPSYFWMTMLPPASGWSTPLS